MWEGRLGAPLARLGTGELETEMETGEEHAAASEEAIHMEE